MIGAIWKKIILYWDNTVAVLSPNRVQVFRMCDVNDAKACPISHTVCSCVYLYKWDFEASPYRGM
jgi:hypothetical protein